MLRAPVVLRALVVTAARSAARAVPVRPVLVVMAATALPVSAQRVLPVAGAAPVAPASRTAVLAVTAVLAAQASMART
jgi:hypothetical protein